MIYANSSLTAVATYNRLHGVTPHKMAVFTGIALRTRNLP